MNTGSIIPIRQAARKTGVPASAIRELERQGRVNIARIQYGGKTFSALVDPAEVSAAARKYGVTGVKKAVTLYIPVNLYERIPRPRATWILGLVRANLAPKAAPKGKRP